MTTTPTIWRATYSPNGNPAGGQSRQQSVGLKDGRILTVWEDASNGPGAGIDIIGRFATAEGVAIGPAFQINYALTSGDETSPTIAAMPDGGFVVAWGGYLEATGGFIAVERFTAAGVHVATNYITSATSSLYRWEIVADSAGNYTVVFARGPQVDLRSVTYGATTDAPGPERTNLGQNAGDDDGLGDIAVLPNGRIVTIYDEPDVLTGGGFEYRTVEFAIVDPATGVQTRPPQQIAGEGGIFIEDSRYANSVVVLTGGQIVLAYSGDFGGSFRICASEAPGSAIGPEVFMASGWNNQLVALPDGGFFAASEWSSGLVEGQRYDVSGNEIGGRVTIDHNGGSLGRLSLTADGRILVPFLEGCEIAQVILDPRENVISGTGLGETLTTQVFDTDLFGEGGDDTLLGQGGNDSLLGGTGHDILRGGGGADQLFGGTGNDVLEGGGGNDTYFLDDANSGLFGDVRLYDTVEESGGGTDTVYVVAQNVADIGADGYTMPANVENGFVTGTFGPFALTGNSWANVLTGHALATTLSGLGGNDRLDGAAGNDALFGGDDDDTLIGGAGNDLLDGGAGSDTADYSAAGVAIVVDLRTTGMQNIGDAGTDTLNGIESLRGSALNDTLIGNGSGNVLEGGGASDRLTGFAGNDTLTGDAGNDIAYGGDGDDVFNGGGDEDFLFGEAGNDMINGGNGLDRLYGDANNDALNGDGGNDILYGGAGNDVLDGGTGNDNMRGEDGNDVYVIDNANDIVVEAAGEGTADEVRTAAAVTFLGAEVEILTGLLATGQRLAGNGVANLVAGGAGNDTITGGAGDDTVNAGGGNDTLYGDSGNDVLNGVLGNDTVYGGLGNDTIDGYDAADGWLGGDADDDIVRGGLGNDRIDGGIGNDQLFGNDDIDFVTGNTGDDQLFGGTGNDIVHGNAGNDFLQGGLGRDTLYGHAGNDAFAYLAADFAGGQVETIYDFSEVAGSNFDTLRLQGIAADYQFYNGAGFVRVYHIAGGGSVYVNNMSAATLADQIVYFA